jgi:pimeloyl-ACP methyl ester carboxylesterase
MEKALIAGYDAAVAEARRQQAECGLSHNSACAPLLMTHGRKTPVAVVWLHGYTNCPRQFEALGRRCYEKGWNVWIPLAPHHGLADRMTEETRLLTVEELARWADGAVDVARGLGDRVVVGGLSMSGAAAAWLGQRRADVAVALSMAPSLSPVQGPPVLSRLAGFLLRIIPNRMIWWDLRLRESVPGPAHAYFRYSTRGLASILRLGFAFVRDARRHEPAAGAFRFVLNDNDEAVSNTLADRIADRWKRRGVKKAAVIRLGRELELRHDYIDPDQPYQHIDVAYPVLIDAIAEALQASG